MKAVLISIKPKWCELIASGKKTVEVRKTKPKLETPFKVYIYATMPKKNFDVGLCRDGRRIGLAHKINYKTAEKMGMEILSGKVIGEFVCDEIFHIRVFENGSIQDYMCHCMERSCVPYDDISPYIGKGKIGYGWHISNLVIYDEPKELTEFIIPSKFGCVNEGKCRGCIYLDRGNGYNVEDDCNAWFSTDDYKPLRKPPQSWCYVEERSGK